jgi:hypothetical protein
VLIEKKRSLAKIAKIAKEELDKTESDRGCTPAEHPCRSEFIPTFLSG